MDFIHEEVNRAIKSFLPPAMPTAATSKNISRKASKLKEVKANALKHAGDYASRKHPRVDHVVTMIRVLLRQYVPFINPLVANKPFSIDGVELDEEIGNFLHVCRDNYTKYKNHFEATGQ